MKQVHLHHRVRTLFADPGFKDSLLKAVKKRYAIFEKKPGFLQQLLKRRELAPAEKHARKVKTQRVAIRKNPEYSQEIINATLAGAAKWAVMGGNEKLSDEFRSLRVAFNQDMMQKDYDKAADLYDKFYDIRPMLATNPMESRQRAIEPYKAATMIS